MEPYRGRCGAAPHRRYCRAAVSGPRKPGDVLARSGGNLGARHVRLRERLAEDADVNEEDVAAVRAYALREVRVLATFGVQRSEEGHGWHGSRSEEHTAELQSRQ